MLVMMMVGCDLLFGVGPGTFLGSDDVPEGYTECGAEAWMHWRSDCGDDVGASFPGSSCSDQYCASAFVNATVICAPGGNDTACCESIVCWEGLSACSAQDCDDGNADDDYFACTVEYQMCREEELE